MARSNYADKPVSDDRVGVLHQHRLVFDHISRAYTPTASEKDIDGTQHTIAADACGDWSWKPHRNQQFSQFAMPALAGLLPSAVEEAARVRHLLGERGAVRYDNPLVTFNLAMALAA